MADRASGDEVPADLSCVMLGDGEGGDAGRALLSFTPAARPRLTEAERDVVLGVVSGLSNAEIAARRSASPRTVANQLAAIFRKLGVDSRAELTAKITLADFA